MTRKSTAPTSSGPGAPVLPSGARAFSIVETATGALRAWSSLDAVPVTALAAVCATTLRQELATLEACGHGNELEEVVLTTADECYVIRPFDESVSHFALLVFEREEMSLVMARIHLDRFFAESPARLSEHRTS
jgi:hypothetical protein